MPHRFPGQKLASLYAQPLEVGLAVVILTVGVGISIYPAATPASIADLAWPWTILFRFLMVTGGAMVLLGALPRRRWSRSSEMVGMIAMGTVFATYAGGLYDNATQTSTLALSSYVVLATASWVKAYALYLEAKVKLAEIRRIPKPDNGEGV